MKKRLFLIIFSGLGSLTLIALTYQEERGINSGFFGTNPQSVTHISKKSQPTEGLNLSIAQEEKLDLEISNLVKKAIELGHYHYAQQQIKIIEDIPLKLELWRKLAHAYLSVGQTQSAYKIVNQAIELDQQNESFDPVTWVTEWILTDQQDKVQELIENLEGDEQQQAQVYLSLAQCYLEMGQLVKGVEYAQLIPSDLGFTPEDYNSLKNELLQKIIDQALPQNNLDLADQVANSFDSKIEQVIALRKLAHQYFKKGNDEEGKKKLEQALEQAKTINTVPIFVDRHTFWSEPNSNLLFGLAQDYQELGDQQKALSILDLTIKSIAQFKTQYTFDFVVWNRSQALRQVATRYLDLGEKEKAIATLELAIKEARKFKRKREILIQELLEIAQIYVKLDQEKEAFLLWEEAFNRLDVIDPKSAELVLETAKVAVLVDQAETGIELVDETQSFLMQLEIAVLAGEENLTKQLAKTKLNQLDKLPFNDDKMVMLEQMALILSENKKLALNFVEQIESPFDKAYILVAIAKKYSQKNDEKEVNTILDKAVTIAETISDAKQREKWIVETTNRLIETHEIDEDMLAQKQLTVPLHQLYLAEQLSEKNKSSKLQAQILFEITERELTEFQEEKAFKAFNKLVSTLKKNSSTQDFLRNFLQLFNLALSLNKNDFALAVAENITNKDYKIVALRQVAQKYALAGNPEKAKNILSETITITQTIENETRKQEIIQGITEQQETLESELK
ncbi:TPR repeat-containing protein [Gloeothece citriformis PCC 7424]|uniref:TPR repeat-containing protein n=1 Tax=Gloeothece citriformis (strain PCC 7424) TaxID=65393 RepID=B7KB00_GLOC7|nr:hypothetical protein [Gloeothece citriformis]ACK70110.1 TPR repeat-containing protein [Gloeothece citriformis PCC 7424]